MFLTIDWSRHWRFINSIGDCARFELVVLSRGPAVMDSRYNLLLSRSALADSSRTGCTGVRCCFCFFALGVFLAFVGARSWVIAC